MKYLIPGHEEQELVELMISFTRINSETVTSALIDHLCRGMSEKDAVTINGTTQSNFNRALAGLNQVAGRVERIMEIRWPKYQELKRNHLNDINSESVKGQ